MMRDSLAKYGPFQEKPLSTNSFIEGEMYSDIVYDNTTCDLPIRYMDHGNSFILNDLLDGALLENISWRMMKHRNVGV